jgi:hypothetical protein
MKNRLFLTVGLVIVISSLLLASQAWAWTIKGGSIECDGFWQGNVDTSAMTQCAVYGPSQGNGNYGSFSVTVWCVNPNNAAQISPPKVTQVSVLANSTANQNGRKEKGKVNLTVNINTEAQIDQTICNQGNSVPGGGQWTIAKVLPSSAFTAVITTTRNNGTPTQEVLSCGNGSLFADGTNMADKVNQITQALQNGVPVSSLNLLYNCTTVSVN